MADIGLSQEQIDALLSQGGGAIAPVPGGAMLTASDFRQMEEFESQAMGNLPSVINAMTGFEYTLRKVEVSEAVVGELPALLGECLVFSMPVGLPDPTLHYLAIDVAFGRSIAAALTGAEPGEGGALDDMHLSAISEVVSQISGSFLTHLSSLLGAPTEGGIAEQAGVASIGLSSPGPLILAGLTIAAGESEPAVVWHVVPLPLARTILSRIAQKAAPATQPVPTPAAAQRPAPPAAMPAPPPVSYATPTPQGGPALYGAVGAVAVAAPQVEYSPAHFAQLAPQAEHLTEVEQRNLDLLLDVPLQITVELGKTILPIKTILDYGQGSLITLEKLAGEPVDLLVNGKYFAKGEVVVIEENFGIRITSILSPVERLGQLG